MARGQREHCRVKIVSVVIKSNICVYCRQNISTSNLAPFKNLCIKIFLILWLTNYKNFNH